MSHHDLRGFLSALERNGHLQRVAVPVDPELETTSLSLRALRAGGPALLMERPLGSDHAYLGNLPVIHTPARTELSTEISGCGALKKHEQLIWVKKARCATR